MDQQLNTTDQWLIYVRQSKHLLMCILPHSPCHMRLPPLPHMRLSPLPYTRLALLPHMRLSPLPHTRSALLPHMRLSPLPYTRLEKLHTAKRITMLTMAIYMCKRMPYLQTVNPVPSRCYLMLDRNNTYQQFMCFSFHFLPLENPRWHQARGKGKW